MKKKSTSMTSLKAYGFKMFSAGYCDLQYIISRDYFQFYNAGVYGWNCDIYIDWSNQVIITTGYRNMRGERIPSDLIAEYSNIGKKLLNDWNNPDYHTMKRDLCDEFCYRLSQLSA